MHTHPEQMKHTRYPLKLFFFFSPKGEIKTEKSEENFKYNEHWGEKVHRANCFNEKSGQKKTVSLFQTKSPLIHTLVSRINDWEVLSSSFSNLKRKKRETWCERKSLSSSRPRVHRSEWDFSSAVGSEVRLCDGWCCSRLLSDVITAWTVALLVWDALREGELVYLRSLFFQLQWGLWKTKARHKNTIP